MRSKTVLEDLFLVRILIKLRVTFSSDMRMLDVEIVQIDKSHAEPLKIKLQ